MNVGVQFTQTRRYLSQLKSGRTVFREGWTLWKNEKFLAFAENLIKAAHSFYS